MAKRDDTAGTRKRDQEVRARLTAILNASEDAIVGNTLDGIITDWNKAAERIYGYSASEVIGRARRKTERGVPDAGESQTWGALKVF